MKTAKKHRSILNSYRKWQIPVLALFGLLAANSLLAQSLTWAPNGIGPSDGGGTWLAGNNWWNGTSIVSGTWTSGTTDGAVFGAGTPGTYAVDLGGNTVYATNVAFNTSGYTVQNGTLNLSGGSGVGFTVAANVGAAIASSLTTGGGTIASVGSGGTLTFTGGGSSGGNFETIGAGTVDFNSGTYAGNFSLWLQGNATLEAATLNLGRLMVGYGANSTFTVNSVSAQITGSGGGGNNFFGRSGHSGTMDLVNGTVTMTANKNPLYLAYDANSQGTLNVSGGTFNMGTALGSIPNYIYVNYAGTGATGKGTLNISGGTVTAVGIVMGNTTGYASGSSANVNVTGGALYLGTGGFSANYSGNLTTSILLSGGTIGAAANWSSPLNATLGTTGGNITFQTADAFSVAHNITWNGVLSGAGGLINTGAGTLTLGGANTYTGNTTVNDTMNLAAAGQLSFKIGANGVNNQVNGSGAITLDGTLNFDLTGADNTTGDIWIIFYTTGGLAVTYDSTFAVNGFTQNGNMWTSADGDYQFNEGNNTLVVVPEPGSSTMLLGGLGMLLAFYRIRR
jgi:autotransporter-associated beta strand protein